MNDIALGQDMKNLIFGSVLTGIAVTAGNFLMFSDATAGKLSDSKQINQSAENE